MFKNTFQSGFLSILYSIGSKPLQTWQSCTEDLEARGRGGRRLYPMGLFQKLSPLCNREMCTSRLAEMSDRSQHNNSFVVPHDTKTLAA